jgi:hypothetical protein
MRKFTYDIISISENQGKNPNAQQQIKQIISVQRNTMKQLKRKNYLYYIHKEKFPK